MGRDEFGVGRIVDQQKPVVGQPEVETGELCLPCGVRDDQLAVDVPDLGLEFRPATGRIDADHGGAGDRGAAQPEQELGGVLEQDSDVERSVAPQRGCDGPAGRTLAYHLVPGPILFPGTDSQSVVTQPVQQHLGDRGAFQLHLSCRHGMHAHGTRSTQWVPP